MNTPAYDILNRPFVNSEVDVLDHFSLKGAIKKITSKVKDVVSDSAKLSVNAATAGVRAIAGKEPIYTTDEMRTGFGKTTSQIQQATRQASDVIVRKFVPGGDDLMNTLNPGAGNSESFTTNTQLPIEEEQTIGDFIQQNPIAVGAGVFALILLLILILK